MTTVLLGAAAVITIAALILILAPEPGFVPKDWER